ncbi:hypothetical protein KR009_000062 [Drosophila setifemur]|nr:hypothetical protein KR009_000062 [Drosophila setifemur]
MLLIWFGLLGVSCVRGAQVYMEFNGHRYSYNTDGDRQDRSVLSPHYESSYTTSNSLEHPSSLQFVQQALRSRQSSNPGIYYNSQDNLATSSLSEGYLTSPPPAPTYTNPHQSHQNFDFSTHQMAHSQHTDPAGNVLGKYSYYDEAGYHELSYKAGAGIGFVVMGGNLAKATDSSAAQPHSEIEVGNGIHANALTNFQELHKYRGYT